MALQLNKPSSEIAERIGNNLHTFEIFAGLDQAVLDDVISKAKVHVKSRYSYIYMPKEASNHIYFLWKGTIKIGAHYKNGREVIKSVLYPRVMFGELAAVGETERENFARAMNKEVIYFSIHKKDFQRLLSIHPKLNLNFMGLIGNRLRDVEDRLESLVFKDARTRIIDFIRDAAIKRGRQVGLETLLQHCLTQQDIANITGTSRQTVTSVLNELKKANQIHFTRNSILIRDVNSFA